MYDPDRPDITAGVDPETIEELCEGLGLKRLVLGSVASGVVAHASCPVLVVR